MKLSRTRLLLVCLAAPVAMVAATTAPASAASAAVAVVTGNGTISPALTAVPSCATGSGNNFSFDGNAAVTGVVNGAPEANVNHHISANGTDLCGSAAAGAGTINVTIDGLGSANGVFVRVGAVVVVALALPVGNIDLGVCAFVPGETPPAPVGTYSVVCGAAAIQ